MIRNASLIAVLLALISVPSIKAANDQETPKRKSTLWYDEPAAAWSQALPIGNGRLGGMVFGETENETITINEDTMWSGGPHDYTNIGSHQYLEQFRALIAEEKYEEAAKFGADHMLGIPRSQKGYQTLGKLALHFEGHQKPENYRRSLNLGEGVVKVEYRIGETQYRREILASNPHQVMAIRLTSDRAKKISFTAALSSPHQKSGAKSNGANSLILTGASDAIRFQSQIKVLLNGGSVSSEAGRLIVSGADSATILLAAATNYVNYKDVSADPNARCEGYLSRAMKQSFDEIKQSHVADHTALFGRVGIDLGGSEAEMDIPTNALLQKVQAGERSSLLEEQLFQFGRYLTIAGARPGTQPLNLVGIWAEELSAPWGGKWTLNINAELNAWPVENTNLAECHEPLLALLQDLRVTGRKVAKEHYDCGGFVAHHNTDLWRGAAPVDTAIHGQWTLGGAWLCRHIWEHYDFSRDIDYLRKYYPTMKESAQFFVDFLIEDKDGFLSTCPAISFEQTFKKPDGTVGRLTYSPTMDNQILRDLFTNCILAAETLDTDGPFREKIRGIRSRLRPTRVDQKTGHIMEWAFPAQQNRFSGQTAAMWGLCPGRQINPKDTPQLAEASVKFLKHIWNRMPGYQKAGSWVTGTQFNEWARLWQPEGAYNTMSRAIKGCLYSNLMMHFYTQKYFQIDGNMGTTAGIAEMLMQSHRLNKKNDPVIDLLPALPAAWPTGSVSGLRARGAFVVDIEWEAGKLRQVSIKSQQGTPLSAHYAGKTIQIETTPGQSYRFDGDFLREQE